MKKAERALSFGRDNGSIWVRHLAEQRILTSRPILAAAIELGWPQKRSALACYFGSPLHWR
jgi:hypothetical protein